MAAKKTVVRFLTRTGIYSKGEIAGFPPHISSKYVEGGRAVLHEDGKRKPKRVRERMMESDKGDFDYETR